MASKRDPKIVSYTMSRIRAKDTSIELKLRKALWRGGMRYRVHYKRLPGSPDIVFPSQKVAIFCDSTFWHGRGWAARKPRMNTNRKYWVKKIEGNMARDQKMNEELRALGWQVLRFWDVDIEKNLEKCVEKVVRAVSQS